jgi:hypothetical protein
MPTATFTTQRYGPLVFDPNDSGYVPRTHTADGRTTRPSLFVSGVTDADLLRRAGAMVDALDAADGFAARARTELAARAASSTVADFLQLHIDELGMAVASAELLASLELVGVGVNPAAPAGFVLTLDYSVDAEGADAIDEPRPRAHARPCPASRARRRMRARRHDRARDRTRRRPAVQARHRVSVRRRPAPARQRLPSVAIDADVWRPKATAQAGQRISASGARRSSS